MILDETFAFYDDKKTAICTKMVESAGKTSYNIKLSEKRNGIFEKMLTFSGRKIDT